MPRRICLACVRLFRSVNLYVGTSSLLASGETDLLASGERDLLASGETDLLASGETDLFASGETDLLASGEIGLCASTPTSSLCVCPAAPALALSPSKDVFWSTSRQQGVSFAKM